MQHVARRTLTANVTATLGVDVPAGASGAWVQGPRAVCCVGGTWIARLHAATIPLPA